MLTTGKQGQGLRVVAFGASAGGLQALRPIVGGLQPNGTTAYIVAHHLSPHHVSNLAEILAANSRLTVANASHGDRLLPDHLYVCPPAHDIEILDDSLTLWPRENPALIAPSIDRLFRSLAASQGQRAVGVVLSGSGHDGTAGAEAINAAGGTVIVQIPEEAVQPAMPEAAIHAGFADLVGNGEQITAWLNHLDSLGDNPGAPPPDTSDRAYAELFGLVTETTGLDVAQYKENTLRRQTIRRYRSLGMSALEQYLAHVREHPEELGLLQQSFMISVSAFFRDPPVFEALEKALRRLVAGKQPGDSIRTWIPGCATGEEAYSVAILLGEILGDRLRNFDVRIFATDIDQEGLDFARAGVYSTATLAKLDSARRQHWFTPEGSGWRVGKVIRELCVFSVHDVIAHPPFIKMDLVSCRNLLIYFKPDQQADLINTFHYGLNPEGLLLLGKSESPGFNSRLFEAIDDGHKLYRRRTGTASHAVRFARLGTPAAVTRPLLPKAKNPSQRQTLVDATQATIVREYGPPGVLVNASFEPLHFFGRSQRYFALPEESADFSVFALCLPELRSELKALCYRLTQENLAALNGVPVEVPVNGESVRVRPVLRRVDQTAESGEQAFLICFEETPLGVDTVPAAAPPEHRSIEETLRLRQELADTREQLQAVIEELEASNEELQSLNEEVQSSSEELQASNEELQSSNEELTTLNDELRVKSQEALQLTTTVSNIQNSIRTSLVVVDREGRVTRYNPLATRIFGLVANDLGQFLYGIPCHLQLPRLREQVSAVIAGGTSLVERVHQGDFHFLMQIDPYRNEVGENAGAVLTFADISDLHQAEQAQQSSEVRFRHVWEASLEGLLVVDADGRMVLVNPALTTMFGYSAGELIGQSVELLVPEAMRPHHAGLRNAFTASPRTRRMAQLLDIQGRRKDGSEFFVEISLSNIVMLGAGCVLAAVSDVTERKQAEQALKERERRLSAIIGYSPSALSLKYPDGHYVLANPNLQRIHHLSEEAIVGKTDFDLFPAATARILQANDQLVLSTLARHAMEEVIPVDGQPRIYMSHMFPILDEAGAAQLICRISFDVTERKRADAELEQHRHQLENLVKERTVQLSELYNRAPCGYHSLNADGVFINVNDTELGWLGYTREEMIGRRRAIDIMAPHCRPIFRENFPRFMETGELPGLELDFIRKDGTVLPILLHARAVFDDSGRFLHSLSTIIDNTERKQAELAWAAARQAAEGANRAKSAFLANMSHEIRTPLNAIIGLGHVMKRGHVDHAQAEKLEKIDSAAQHLLAIVSDILDLSKIEADKLVLEAVNFDLRGIAANVVSMLHDRAAGKGLALVVECDDFAYPVQGDPTRFTQALLNLASNALKFTPAGTITIRIRRQEERGGRVLVRTEVEDTGIGIAPAILPRLFSAFEQGDPSNTREHGGTGLGLAITKRLAGLMGGNAGASSEVGVGSTFWFTAWMGIAESAPAAAPEPATGESDEAILARDFRGSRVLLVEDEPTNREVAQMFLDDVGLDVTVAENGAVALALARQQRFALVLMDMQMPEMDGLEATREIRALPDWSAVPIIAMTANAFAEDRSRCLAAGMDDFITKPFDPDKLFATLSHWLAKTKATDTAA